MNSRQFDDPSAERLEQAFAKIINANTVRLALIGERAQTIPFFYGEGDASNDGPRYVLVRRLMVLSGFIQKDLAFYLSITGTNLELAASESPANLRIESVADEIDPLLFTNKYYFCYPLLHRWANLAFNDARTRSYARLIELAFAVERFRQSNDRLPGRLDELTPYFLLSVPTDPFDGKPLRYRVLAKGFVVYSVGEDGRDNAGRQKPLRAEWVPDFSLSKPPVWYSDVPAPRPGSPAQNAEEKIPYDITFTVER